MCAMVHSLSDLRSTSAVLALAEPEKENPVYDVGFEKDRIAFLERWRAVGKEVMSCKHLR